MRSRVEFSIVGSPLAHEAFLRRDRGTYGMAWAAGTSAPFAGSLGKVLPFPFPNLKTPIDGLLRCGDSCFPGIGTPSAAASGAIAANSLVDVDQHIQLLKETSTKSDLYAFLDPGPLANLYKPFVGGFTPSPELRRPRVSDDAGGGSGGLGGEESGTATVRSDEAAAAASMPEVAAPSTARKFASVAPAASRPTCRKPSVVVPPVAAVAPAAAPAVSDSAQTIRDRAEANRKEAEALAERLAGERCS